MKPDPAPHHELQLQPITSTTGNEQGAKNDEDGHEDEGREAKTTTWWWVKLLICAAVITVGQTATVLLGRLYFVKGGTSKWISFISQLGGFPMLIPYYIYSNFFVVRQSDDHSRRRQRPLTYGAFYVFQGLLLGGSTYLYTIGLQYLPVSTSSLIVSSQLGFNAFFSYFINSQRFTPLITNSLFLLTVSSVLLVFGDDNSSSSAASSSSPSKYALGFICTMASASGYGLNLSVAEYAFRKMGSFRIATNMLMFQGMVATGFGIIGLFASGEWRMLNKEMEDGYELGKVAYVMTLTWTALSFQVFSWAMMVLVIEVSSVFSNVVGTVALPVAPLLAVAIFDDRMSGVKAIAMVLAVWGFLSYLYQQYLDGRRRNSRSAVVVEA